MALVLKSIQFIQHSDVLRFQYKFQLSDYLEYRVLCIISILQNPLRRFHVHELRQTLLLCHKGRL